MYANGLFKTSSETDCPLSLKLTAAPARVERPVQDSMQRERSRVESAERALESAEAAAAGAESDVAEVRSQVRAMELQQQQMAQLADLALQLLGPHCPVCAQSIDAQAVSERLQQFRSLDAHGDLGATASLAAALEAASPSSILTPDSA